MLRIIKGFAASVAIAFLIMFSSAITAQADEYVPTPCSANCTPSEPSVPDPNMDSRTNTNNSGSNPDVYPNGECTNCEPEPPQSSTESEYIPIGEDGYESYGIEVSPEYLDRLIDEAAAGKQASIIAMFVCIASGVIALFSVSLLVFRPKPQHSPRVMVFELDTYYPHDEGEVEEEEEEEE